MPVNDFEKQVQQKMEELQLRPSPEVWTGVEARIRRDKRRRRLIFWWLLPVLLGGGMLGYYLLTQGSGELTQTSRTSVPTLNKIEPGEKIKENTRLQESPPPEKNPGIDPSGAGQPAGTKEPAPLVTEIKQVQHQPGKRSFAAGSEATASDRRKTVNKNVQPDPKQLTIIDRGRFQRDESIPLPGRSITADSISKAPLKNEGIPVQQPILSPGGQKDSTIKKDTLFAAVDAVNITPKALADSTAVEPSNPIKINKKSPWQFAIMLKPGMSNVRKGGIFEGGTHSSDALSSPNLGSGVNFAPYASAPPAQIPHETFSLGIEFTAQKKIGKRLMLQAGIDYADLRSRIKVGRHIDNTGSLFNANAPTRGYYQAPGNIVRNYYNNYHLLGVKAGLGCTVVNTRKFSLRWENALSLQQLIASNGLHYDRSRAIYYQDFRPYRKTHLLGSTGLAFPLLSRQQWNLELAPAVSYSFTSLLKNSGNSPSHFINYSVGLRFLFPQR